MNPRIEPHFDPSASRLRSSPDGDVQSLVAALSAAPVAIAIGADAPQTTRTVREAAIAVAAAGGPPAPGQCGDIVVVFGQWAGEPCVGLIDTIAIAVDSATGTLVTRPNPNPRSLADVLAYWSERCGANFVIVLEHFDRNLAAEPLKTANARFTEQLAQAIEAEPQRARFLLVVHADDERLMQRLSARLSRSSTKLVRLAPPPVLAQRAQAAPRKAPAPQPHAEGALPHGFSAYGEEQVDNAATDAMLGRRQARRRKAKLGMLAATGLIVVATVAVAVMAVRSRVPDPGALLTRSNEPRAVPPAPPAPAAAPQSPASPAVDADPAPPAAPQVPATDAVRAAPGPAQTAEPLRQHPPLVAAAPLVPEPSPPAAVAEPAATAPERAPAATEDAKPALKPDAKLDAKPAAPPGDTPPAPKKAERPAAFGVDAPPGAPVAEKLVRSVPNPERGPMLFIHIRDDAQRARARELERNLARLGIVVSGIKVDERGPLRSDLRYFRSGERDEANYLRTVLGRLGMSPARTTLVSGYESIAASRHYEFWLAPPAAP